MTQTRLAQAGTVALVVVLVASTIPAASITAAGSPDGHVSLADSSITSDLPSDWSGLEAGDLHGHVSASDHASTTEVVVTTPERAAGYLDDSSTAVGGGSVALVIRDDEHEAGREISVDADVLESALGEVPDHVYGRHDDGTRWVREVRLVDGDAVWTIPHFSSNTVTFETKVEVKGSFEDGSAVNYSVADLSAVSGLDVSISGETVSAWDNETVDGTTLGYSNGISVSGNRHPVGPGGGETTLRLSLSSDRSTTVSESWMQSTTDSSSLPSAVGIVAAESAADRVMTIEGGSSAERVLDSVDVVNATHVDATSGTAVVWSDEGQSDGGSLVVIDTSDPSSISVVGSVDLGGIGLGYVDDIAVDGDSVLLVGGQTVAAVDISTSSSPTLESDLTDSRLDGASGVDLDGGLGTVATEVAGTVVTIDTTDPTALSISGTVERDALTDAQDLVLRGDYVYAVGQDLVTVDVSTPSTPTSVDTDQIPGNFRVSANNNHLFVASTFSDKIKMYHYLDGSNPEHVETLEAHRANSVSVSDGKMFVTNYEGRIDVYPYRVQDVVASTDTGQSASYGTILVGSGKTKPLNVSLDTTTLSYSGSGASPDQSLRLRERVETDTVEISVNNDSATHSGRLADGETQSLSLDPTAIDETTTISVDVGDGSLSADAPTPRVRLDYAHDASTYRSVNYSAERFSESYNVSRQFSDEQESVSLRIDHADSVHRIDSIERSINGSTWSSIPSGSYRLVGSELVVDLDSLVDGQIDPGTQIDVRSSARKITVVNGSIDVTEPTLESEPLDSRIEITSRSGPLSLDLGDSTPYVVHGVQTSYSGTPTLVRSASGDRTLRLRGGDVGDTLRLQTVPVDVEPDAGRVEVEVVEADPLTLRLDDDLDGAADRVTLEYVGGVDGATYRAVSLSSARSVDADEADPVSRLSADTGQTVQIERKSAGGPSVAGAAGEGAGGGSLLGDSVLLVTTLLGVGLGIVGSVVVGRRVVGLRGTRLTLATAVAGGTLGLIGVETITSTSITARVLSVVGLQASGALPILVTVGSLLGLVVLDRRTPVPVPRWLYLVASVGLGLWSVVSLFGPAVTSGLERVSPLLWLAGAGLVIVVVWRSMQSRDIILRRGGGGR